MSIQQSLLSLKNLSLIGFITCIALLASAYFFEYQMELEPCPMCIMQRIATLMVAIGCLFSWLFHANTILLKVSSVWTLLSSFFGIYLSNHHRWLQSLPEDQVPACGPSLEYMVDALPINEIITVLLRGNGNCAEVSWSFLSLSMPAWLLVFFIGFAIASGYACWQSFKRSA